MTAKRVRPRDLKFGDLWRHWTGTKTVTYPIKSVEKKQRDGTTVYRVVLDIPDRDRNYVSAIRYLRPTGWAEIEVEEPDAPTR